jgi:Putative esterase
VVRHSKLTILWPVGLLLVFGLVLALFISTGTGPQGTLSQGVPTQRPATEGTTPHQVAADPAASSGNFRYLGTNVQGIASYSVTSADNGPGPQTVRVLTPTHPAPGVAHNFLIVLPVEAGLGSTFGDGLATLQALNAQDKYDLTIIEPTFAIDPWYANNPDNPKLRYETFMTRVLVPWIKQTLATTGHEQVWLIGFSKSGLGAQDLILKHPGLFTLAASWDSPFGASSYNQFGNDSAANYGTDANFQANYRLTAAFLSAHNAPFLTSNRIWIGGYALFQTDDSDYDALLSSEGIAHSTETPQYMAHRWDSGWVPIALAALYQDSINVPRS